MKKMMSLAKIVLYILTGFFLIMAIVGLFVSKEGEMAIVVFMLISAFFTGVLAYRIHRTPPEEYAGKLKKAGKEFFNNSNNNYEKINSDKLIVSNGRVLQVLETIEIISSTRSIDTLKSRYKFLKSILPELIKDSNSSEYKVEFQQALDYYKQAYYDKTPTQDQLQCIISPDSFNIEEYLCRSLYTCFLHYYDFQKKEINLLKTKKGKMGRHLKVLEILSETQEFMIQNCSNSENFEKFNLLFYNQRNELTNKVY